MPDLTSARAAREFAIRNVLTSRCGERLTPDAVDAITEEIAKEMADGGTSWAFRVEDHSAGT